jgi:hypothetical protein
MHLRCSRCSVVVLPDEVRKKGGVHGGCYFHPVGVWEEFFDEELARRARESSENGLRRRCELRREIALSLLPHLKSVHVSGDRVIKSGPMSLDVMVHAAFLVESERRAMADFETLEKRGGV